MSYVEKQGPFEHLEAESNKYCAICYTSIKFYGYRTAPALLGRAWSAGLFVSSCKRVLNFIFSCQ
jgi:hypothetical protein